MTSLLFSLMYGMQNLHFIKVREQYIHVEMVEMRNNIHVQIETLLYTEWRILFIHELPFFSFIEVTTRDFPSVSNA
jgi:hypothetical protein